MLRRLKNHSFHSVETWAFLFIFLFLSVHFSFLFSSFFFSFQFIFFFFSVHFSFSCQFIFLFFSVHFSLRSSLLVMLLFFISVYAASVSDLIVLQSVLKRCHKRRYTSVSFNILELLEKVTAVFLTNLGNFNIETTHYS